MGCWGMGIKKSSHKVSEPHDYSGIYFSEATTKTRWFR
jgi:hypothetical protein